MVSFVEIVLSNDETVLINLEEISRVEKYDDHPGECLVYMRGMDGVIFVSKTPYNELRERLIGL